MFHLSDSDRQQSYDRARRVITDNAFSVLTDWMSPHTGKEDASVAMMAIEWAPALGKSVGFKPLNGALKYVRADAFGPERYRLFSDMSVRASDEEISLERAAWRILAMAANPVASFRNYGCGGLGRAHFAL